ALGRLTRAVAIVEERRVRLTEDAHRQMYVATCAHLYQRACDLAIRLRLECEETVRWSERAKARAMLDAMHEYDSLRVWQIERGGAKDRASMIPSIRDLQSAAWWTDDLALIEYTKLPRGAYVWLITKHLARQFHVLANLVEVEQQAKRLARTLQTKSNTDDRWVEPASWLYDRLIRPLEKDLQGIDRLVIVWDAQLPQIPFETMVCQKNAHKDRFIKHELLIERWAVSYAPSAALLRAVAEQEMPVQWTWDFWGFATSQFESRDQRIPEEMRSQTPGSSKAQDPSLRNLPQAPGEVRDISENYFNEDRTRLLIDQNDSKAKLVKAASGAKALSVRFLHFATHAAAGSEDKRRSGLYLGSPTAAPGTTTPSQAPRTDKISDLSSVRHSPGKASNQTRRQWNLTPAPTSSVSYVLPHRAIGETNSTLLTLREIAGLNLRCQLVTLNGCGTVGKEPIPGDWLNGLTRAFLIGGSTQAMCEGVVCTLWDVPDSAALAASTTFYHSLFMDGPDGPVDAATALQRMKCAWLRSPMFGHPNRWSAYVYVGKAASQATDSKND
ncbi:MAG: CHAT domain-containing protein, partial [Dehalococcoidia bacterium]